MLSWVAMTDTAPQPRHYRTFPHLMGSSPHSGKALSFFVPGLLERNSAPLKGSNVPQATQVASGQDCESQL